MPIRFRCEYCGQLLSIAKRKAGATVGCPKCEHRNQVPDDDTPEEPKQVASVSAALESLRLEEWLLTSKKRTPVKEVVPTTPAAGVEFSFAKEEPGLDSPMAVEWDSDPETTPLPARSWLSGQSLVILGLVILVLGIFALGILVGKFLL